VEEVTAGYIAIRRLEPTYEGLKPTLLLGIAWHPWRFGASLVGIETSEAVADLSRLAGV